MKYRLGRIELRWRKPVILMLALAAGVSMSLATNAQAAAKNSSYAISAGIAEHPVGKPGETFASYTVSVKYSAGQTVTLAGDPKGTAVYTIGGYSGNVYVDDAMDITVVHPDGTAQNWTNEWTFECFGLYPSGPLDLSGLFQPGKNKVRITLRDECGGDEGSTPLYFIGNAGFAHGATSDPAALATFGNDGWLATQVAPGADQGFQAVNYNDSTWPNDQAPFNGEFNGNKVIEPCPAWDSNYGTGWTARTKDLLIRRHLTYPVTVTKAMITGDLEGTATVYFNGKKVQHITNTSCHQFAIKAEIPGSAITAGDNVLALRVSGTGSGNKRHGFVDLQVSYVPTHTDPPPTYVALGDSYSSGEGLSPYTSDSDTSGNTCHRSKTQAYPEQISGHDSGLPLEFHACSGAGTGSYFNENSNQHNPSEPRQNWWLHPETMLVTMTFGGDNLDWTSALIDCTKVQLLKPKRVPHYDAAKCGSDLNKLRDQEGTIQSKLIDVYNDTLTRAPNAQVRILGYPPVFPARNGKTSDCRIAKAPDLHLDLTANVEQQAVDLETQVNSDIKAAVDHVRGESAANSRLEFIDTEAAFGGASGHAITCGDSGAPAAWINDVTISKSALKQLIADIEAKRWSRLNTDLFDTYSLSFHPKAIGQQKMADALTATLPK